MNTSIQHYNLCCRSLAFIFTIAIFMIGVVPSIYAQTDEPLTVEADVPFEMRVPWMSDDRTEIEDEVVLRGWLHITTRTWQTRVDHIDRFSLHANAVDIHGTSETTGQRYRANGSFKFDLRDPEVTFLSDGTFRVPMQEFRLPFHKVDPQPAQATVELFGYNGATGAAVFYPPPAPIPCERVYTPDGTPTISIYCGNITYEYFSSPVPYFDRVLSSGGSSCAGNPCVVPDGATLFNGYTGGYNSPLFLVTRVNLLSTNIGNILASSVRMFCKTGNREATVTPVSFVSGTFIGKCQPLYSAVEPITVGSFITYKYYRYLSDEHRTEQVDLIVPGKTFTFRMDERPTGQPPVITSFSVKSIAMVNTRCALGELCELVDGDRIYNGQDGDYGRDLVLNVTASDPENNPLTVEWFCQLGDAFATITDQSGGGRTLPSRILPNKTDIHLCTGKRWRQCRFDTGETGLYEPYSTLKAFWESAVAASIAAADSNDFSCSPVIVDLPLRVVVEITSFKAMTV